MTTENSSLLDNEIGEDAKYSHVTNKLDWSREQDAVVVRHVSKSYRLEGREEAVTALRDINLCNEEETYAIKKGEFVMIRGPSGGGKTTLLNLIGTLDYPSSGTIEILGEKIDKHSKDSFLAKLRLHRIGFVFQTFNLIATMSAFENVQLPMTIAGKLSRSETVEKAKKLLQLVGLQDRLEHLPSELSGGEQQRVTIARALANDPEILLLDEPTGDLDTRNTVEIMDILLNINRERKTTFLMVTHNPDLECYADRILYVRDGVFEKQILNETQATIDLTQYLDAINRRN